MSDCTIQCRGQINVSLDQNCVAEITPAMGGVGIEPMCNDFFDIELFDHFGNLLPTDTVDFSQVGELLTYKIIEPECGNACWGDLLVDYKLAPTIDCPADITIPCALLGFLCPPPATGGCVDFTVSLVGETSTKLDCDPDFTQIVERTFQACDDFGNCSTCTQTITLERLDFDNIIFPEPFTVGNGTAISCTDDNIQFDSNGFPIPFLGDPMTGSGSGVPVLCIPPRPATGGYASIGICIDGMFPITGSGTGAAKIPLIPDNIDGIGTNLDVCNAVISFTDLELPSNGCVRKIARTFEIREWWCSDELSTGSIQLIEIVDDQAPLITCPSDFTITTAHECAGSINLPPAQVFDECGNDFNVRIQTPNGLVDGNGGILDLNLGVNTITYIATDICNNQSNCQVNVTVQDNTGPVAICETSKVVSLSASNNSIVFAEPFDNGSFDECGLDRFEVRRMIPSCEPSDSLFGEFVTFCCADVGSSDVMVVFRAVDKSGNTNECMVLVEVQDKSVPTLTCPADMTIDCREFYDINNLSLTFGSPTTGGNCTAQNFKETPIADVDQCGIGTIIREFEVFDSQGNVVRKCTQNVTITNDTPFLSTNIIFPLDLEILGACTADNLDPEDLLPPFNVPTFINADICTQLAFDFEDRVFEGNNGLGSCITIERTWTVINWCGDLDGDGNFDRFVNPKPQIITIINNTNPVIQETGPLTFTSTRLDCTSGPICVTLTATDDCDVLNYRYELLDVNGTVITFGDQNNISTDIPVGQYTISWFVSDGCGNFDTYLQPIEVLNTKLPTPVCINGLTANLALSDLDMDGVLDAEIAEIWATDFDSGSSNSCGNPVVISFSPDTTDIVKIFDCNSIGINSIRMYVTDVRTGLQDFCSTFIEIQDNNGQNICEPTDGMRVAVTGDIFTEDIEPVFDVEVTLISDVLVEMTDENGAYAFNDMPIGGTYNINADKDRDYLNGVSTLDLIFIQKHILGLEQLDSPYKIIAADADNSESITAIDLIEIRKLILGVYDEFPNNESWRFIEADQTFIDPLNPWLVDLRETHIISQLDTNINIDFIGVKIGDVNGTVVPNLQSGDIDKRSNSDVLQLYLKEQLLEAGETYVIDIYSDNYSDIMGWQSTFSFNNEAVDILDITSSVLDLQKDRNANMTRVEEGLFTLSYNDHQAISLSEEGPVMQVVISANEVINTNDLFTMTSDITRSEAYNANGEILDLRLSTDKSPQASITSVSPNPWNNETMIEMTVPIDGNTKWEFYDVNGKLLYTTSQYYSAGVHTMPLRKEDINASGIIYAKMITKSGISEYKMIVL
ncbi:T9SS type A sorting domain-containing protein [Saprospiraceae bacterium]|nr:T9SS type A sorting domain-containing protein [Saprospiraceae bacterium]